MTKEKVGDIFESNQDGKFEIVDFNHSFDVKVRFIGYPQIIKKTITCVRKRTIKNKYLPKVFGKGYLGEGPYKSKVNGKTSNVYNIWIHMLSRCYNEKDSAFSSYGLKGVKVHSTWHNFQVFAKWVHQYFSQHIGLNPEEKHGFVLDKDSKIPSLKIKRYGPDTCCFILLEENSRISNAYCFIEAKLKAPDGKIHEVKNLRAFCKEHGLQDSNMQRVIKGERKHHKGWTVP